MTILNDYDYWGDDDNDNEVTFMLVTDNNGNWYVIDVMDETNFYDWIANKDDEDSPFDFDDCMINDIHSLRFFSYWEG